MGSTSLDLTGHRTSAAVYRVAGREYPYKVVPQCRVCSSTYRAEIEESLLKGYTAVTIARSMPEDSRISVRNIRDHILNGHLPTDIGVRNVIIEQRAEEIGRAAEMGRGPLADHVTMARLGIQQVVEKLAKGEMDLDMKDGVALANFLLKAEEKAGGDEEDLDQAAITQSFFAYLRAAQQIMSAEQFQELGKVLSADPVLRGLRARATPVAESQED